MMARYDARLGLYIGGEWLGVDGRDTSPVLDPATGAELARLPLPARFAPWEHPELARRVAPGYPARPQVDLAAGRADALAAFAALRGGRAG